MRVLLVSHTCMSRMMGQPKLHCLAALPRIELTALVPDRMYTSGQWRFAEQPEHPDFRFVTGQLCGQNVFRQRYLQHYPRSLGRLLCETQPDIVDIWEEPWSLVAAQTAWLTRLLCPQAKIIVESEQNILKTLPQPFARFQSYSLAQADMMVARSEEAKDVLRHKGFQKAIHIVPNAVDCQSFKPLPFADRMQIRRELGWGTAKDFVIGYVGRLVPEKGLTDIIAAARTLSDAVRIIFVGCGPQRQELMRRAQSLNLQERVHFTGQMPLTDLPGLINAMDVLVLPSRTTAAWKEQFGRVLIEAGACGISVIGSSSGAIPSVVADAGLVYPEGDIAALTECLNRLHADKALRERLGAIGRERAVRLFSWQEVAAQMHGIYEELITDHR